MKIIFVLLCIFYLSSQLSYSQPVYFTPEEIIKSYNNKSRSLDGNPGIYYWQNKSEYDISVNINTKEKILEGKETIKYYNVSPDDLKQLVFRLYQDFSIPGKSRDWEVDQNEFTEGTIIKVLKINNKEINLNDSKVVQRPGTNLIVNPEETIFSKSITDIYFEWSFKIPGESFPRMGTYDSTSYMIAYWYPQIAVYDDIDGWDKIDYKGQVEFYNDFSDYDVKINTDKENIFVWSTGVLQNPENVLSDNFLERYKKESGNIITLEDIEKNKKFIKNGKNTVWHYKAENVPDFVFSLSDHFLWDKETVTHKDGRKTTVNAVYRENEHWGKYIAGIAKGVIEFLSNDFPAVPYPYPYMTVFNGEGGMEYPMMVNDGITETWESTVYLTAHEITHSYFPFYMGINERKYAFMDEGYAVFLPQEFQNEWAYKNPEIKNTNPEYNVRVRNVNNYLKLAGTFYDVPALVPSVVLRAPSYRQNAYSKAALIYDILRDMLGKELYEKALRDFMRRWNGKHPTPYDFFNSFNNFTDKDYNWFWKKWFMEYLKPDLALKSAVKEGNKIKIVITNEGGLPLPIELNITLANNKKFNIHKTAEVWSGETITVTITGEIDDNIKSVKLGSPFIPDINEKNNVIEY